MSCISLGRHRAWRPATYPSCSASAACPLLIGPLAAPRHLGPLVRRQLHQHGPRGAAPARNGCDDPGALRGLAAA
eukprot:1295920-Pyramimonas_sp.AAC.1